MTVSMKTDLLRGQVISDSFLEALPNALFGDSLQITLVEDRINDRSVGCANI